MAQFTTAGAVLSLVTKRTPAREAYKKSARRLASVAAHEFRALRVALSLQPVLLAAPMRTWVSGRRVSAPSSTEALCIPAKWGRASGAPTTMPDLRHKLRNVGPVFTTNRETKMLSCEIALK
jgi:hypothetical protein